MSAKRPNRESDMPDRDVNESRPDESELDELEFDGEEGQSARFSGVGGGNVSEEELRDMSSDELQTLAADLQIEGRTRMSREELISAISENRSQ